LPDSGQQSAEALKNTGILWNKGHSEFYAPVASLSDHQ
jgi:hypothetical protein